VAGAFAAVLLLGLQTDVIGVHWLAVVVWAAAGIALGRPPARTDREDEIETATETTPAATPESS